MDAESILIQTTKKLISLNQIPEWNNELISKAPPVLWFGNSSSVKEKIITVGANPSRWEFLDQKLLKSYTTPIPKVLYEDKYLSTSRFHHLESTQNYNDILLKKDIRESIINSYDTYFLNNPYKWFGTNKHNSYNVEGVLRGFNASYFEINTEYRACHIDIFPFATISDFKNIRRITERDLLNKDWAKNIVDQLLVYLDPKLIFVFGRTNFNYFSKYFNIPEVTEQKWESSTAKGKCTYWNTYYKNIQVIGASTNLGNPKGFDALGLRELGQELKTLVNSTI